MLAGNTQSYSNAFGVNGFREMYAVV